MKSGKILMSVGIEKTNLKGEENYGNYSEIFSE